MTEEDDRTTAPSPTLCDDYTIADAFETMEPMLAVRTYLADRPEDTITVTHSDLDTALSPDVDLSTSQAVSLFVGLVNNDAASEVEIGSTYADYTFRIDVEAAISVLDQQLIAHDAISELGLDVGHEETDVELVATLPPVAEPSSRVQDNVVPLPEQLRALLLDADDSVRIANPYFDPGQSIIDDIGALLERGVDIDILTRTVDDDDHRQVVRTLGRAVEAHPDSSLRIRELLAHDADGSQEFATHAKTIILDESLCYIGSANLTETSLSTNFELGIIGSAETAERAAMVFDSVFEVATSVDTCSNRGEER